MGSFCWSAAEPRDQRLCDAAGPWPEMTTGSRTRASSCGISSSRGTISSSGTTPSRASRVRNDASITPPDCSDALDVEALGAADYTLVRVSLEETAAACPSAFTSTQLSTTLALTDFTTLRTFTLQTGTASELVLGTLTGFTIAPDRPANDDCANAIALPPTFGTTPYDATGATTDGLTALFACDYGSFSDEQNHNDVWFTYTPAVGGCTYV